MIQLPLGMPREHLAFQFELHDGGRLLHPGHDQILTHPAGLGLEMSGRIVGVDGPDQMLQRRERDAVAFVELTEAPVTERDSQDVADQGLMPQSGAEPGHIVVAPDERDVRLVSQIIDDAIAARAAIPAVAADDQLVDRQVADQATGDVNQVQRPAAQQQFIDNGLDELAAAFVEWLVQHLREQVGVLAREDLHRPLQAVA